MVSIGRICDQQQSIFGNKGISIHGKLQKRAKNRSKYQKEGKSGESTEFAERIKKVQKEAGAALKKV